MINRKRPKAVNGAAPPLGLERAEAGAGALLVACRLAGLSALERYSEGVKAVTQAKAVGVEMVTLGACLLNPGEMGFEPLKPVGEPDAANSRIRFDVRVEALRPSFVAPFPRWRSSAGCECGKGRGPPLGELQDIVGEADEAPLVGDLLDAAQEKLTEAARLLDLSEHRLGQLLS